MLVTRGSPINCSGDMFWDGIFLARFGPMFTKKSLNLELMVALSVMHDPSFNLNLGFTWHVLFLFTMFLNICQVFFKLCLFCSKISWKCFLSAYFRIWFSLLRYLLYITSLAVVFNFINFTYNLFFVLIASFNDWDSHGFRVLYFFVTVLLGKCLLNNLSKVEWNQVKDSCAFPEIYNRW